MLVCRPPGPASRRTGACCLVVHNGSHESLNRRQLSLSHTHLLRDIPGWQEHGSLLSTCHRHAVALLCPSPCMIVSLPFSAPMRSSTRRCRERSHQPDALVLLDAQALVAAAQAGEQAHADHPHHDGEGERRLAVRGLAGGEAAERCKAWALGGKRAAGGARARVARWSRGAPSRTGGRTWRRGRCRWSRRSAQPAPACGTAAMTWWAEAAVIVAM